LTSLKLLFPQQWKKAFAQLPVHSKGDMLRSRYGEASDTADDDGAAPLVPPQARSSPVENARLNRADFRLQCANERLYEAYSELHGLAQGERCVLLQ